MAFGKMRAIFVLLLLIAAISAAHAYGIGEGSRFSKLGSFKKSGGGAVVTCVPGSTTGQFDFSVCSNIIYIPALIH